MKEINVLLFSLLLLTFSCTKEEALLLSPEEFQDIPDQSIAASIDGQLVSKSSFSVSQIVQDRTFIVATNEQSSLTIVIKDKRIGEYEFNDFNKENFVEYQIPSSDGSTITYSTFGKNPNGYINLEEINTFRNSISGSFEAVLLNTADNTDTLRVTNGFFNDAPYY